MRRAVAAGLMVPLLGCALFGCTPVTNGAGYQPHRADDPIVDHLVAGNAVADHARGPRRRGLRADPDRADQPNAQRGRTTSGLALRHRCRGPRHVHGAVQDRRAGAADRGRAFERQGEEALLRLDRPRQHEGFENGVPSWTRSSSSSRTAIAIQSVDEQDVMERIAICRAATRLAGG